jgi:hypothetical protein
LAGDDNVHALRQLVRGAASRAKGSTALWPGAADGGVKWVVRRPSALPGWVCASRNPADGALNAIIGGASTGCIGDLGAYGCIDGIRVLAATCTPDWTRMVWPWALGFFRRSGVMATRVSPAMISAGHPKWHGDYPALYLFAEELTKHCDIFGDWHHMKLTPIRQAFAAHQVAIERPESGVRIEPYQSIA